MVQNAAAVLIQIHQILIITFTALHGQAPVCISDLLHPYLTSRGLMSSEQACFWVVTTFIPILYDYFILLYVLVLHIIASKVIHW